MKLGQWIVTTGAALAALLWLCGAAVKAQDEPEGTERKTAFKLYRWQEDYSYLAGKELSDWERLKYIRIAEWSGAWLSLGGEVRYRLDGYDRYLFGLGRSGYAWASSQERIFQHVDLHWSLFRAFVQVDAAAEDGRPVQRAFDRSSPDLRNGFLDLILPAGDGRLTLRGGRQELWLGPSRWLAVRDPTNLRRSFDGALAEYDDAALTLRGFTARPVDIMEGLFDDATLGAERFRGGYLTLKSPFGLPGTLDLYGYAKQQDSVSYRRGTASEDRWTAGLRLALKAHGFEMAAEAARQGGSFGAASIDAVGGFADLGQRLKPFALGDATPVTPKLGLRGHYASGDSNLNDGRFRTFVAAYPAASVVSEMSLVSVSNLINLQPYLQLFVGPTLTLGASWNVLRKATAADSVYGPTGTLITAKNSSSLDVARIAQLDMVWDASKFLQLHALYSHVYAGGYVVAAGGRDFDYYRLQLMARW
ncbi:MAG TPA: alginate export family protein [Rhodopseudomonas sp.]|uniref:alginate export family protein n=1 Tax=Rhodopseudomonas sp. TaxID=1078 RepID=UPI002ED88C5C